MGVQFNTGEIRPLCQLRARAAKNVTVALAALPVRDLFRAGPAVLPVLVLVLREVGRVRDQRWGQVALRAAQLALEQVAAR